MGEAAASRLRLFAQPCDKPEKVGDRQPQLSATKSLGRAGLGLLERRKQPVEGKAQNTRPCRARPNRKSITHWTQAA